MKTLTLVALLAALAACAPSAPPTCSAPSADAGAVSALKTGNAAFATDLFGPLAAGASGRNFFYSPFSVSEALSMAYAGAATQTAQQMGQTLHVDAVAAADLPPAFARLDCQIETDGRSDGNQMDVANALFGQKETAFLAPFVGALSQDYGAPLQQVDFASDQTGATQDINGWVSNATQGKIPKLLQGPVDASTVLVLVNAVYFKGEWATKFETSQTQPGAFTTGSGSQVQVPLMNGAVHGSYFKGQDYAVMELPYQGSQLAMDVVLPDSPGGLPALANSLGQSGLAAWVPQLAPTDAQVTLPRFSLDTRTELSKTLSALGMPLAFQPGAADFSGMDGGHDFFISTVVHEATVDVDESGTTATAATAVEVGTMAVEVPTVTFDANHPFVVLLRDLPTGTILFAGEVTDPSQVRGT